ncbi:MFS transporter [Streptomyces halobius]|uniref:MFS transporter n=1 Tax=Streptomyces halobius TaxID=2879846 RepID=A0ABY4LZI1_9ACTN|nr:MFS transporter [Streptomyces halobius]UQA90863.1 MFS transporter [Streptomyces halobius]
MTQLCPDGGSGPRLAVYGVLPYTSLWLQSLRNLSPIGAGLVVLPHAAAACLVALVSGRLMLKPSPRVGATAGLALAGIGVGTEGFLTADSHWPAIVVGLAVSGLGMGLIFQVAAALALGTVQPARAGMASGAYSTFEQLGYAIGVDVFGTLAVASMGNALSGQVADPHEVAQTLSGGGAGSLLGQAPGPERATLDHTLHAAFAAGHNTLALTAAVVLLLSAVAVLLLTRRLRPRRDTPPVMPVMPVIADMETVRNRKRPVCNGTAPTQPRNHRTARPWKHCPGHGQQERHRHRHRHRPAQFTKPS